MAPGDALKVCARGGIEVEPPARGVLDTRSQSVTQNFLDAYHWLASGEGVFCEPASAASVAGLLAHGLPVLDGPLIFSLDGPPSPGWVGAAQRFHAMPEH